MTDEVAPEIRVTGVADAAPFFFWRIIMHPFDKYVSAVKAFVNDNTLDQSEYMRLGQSEYRWSVFRTRGFKKNNIKRGSVYQFDFGKNTVPEMSYEHRGLVIGVNKNLLYVLPIFTYRSEAHDKDLYSPEKKNGNLYLLKASEHSFLKHDSVLKLQDLRCISTKRLLYRQNGGYIPINSKIYKEIELLAFSRVFPQFHYELMELRNNAKSRPRATL